nr:hypothetical protein [Candidatus Njordarchaeota archaeon]
MTEEKKTRQLRRKEANNKQHKAPIWIVLIVAFAFATFLFTIQLSLLLGESWVLSATGVAWLLVPYCLLVESGFRSWFWSTLMRADPDIDGTEEFSNLTGSQLAKSSQMLTEGLVMLSGVYGILLAFVVSDKASIAFSSWGLLIWIGLVLSIIIQLFLYTLRIVRSGNEDTSRTKQDIYYRKKFMKLSVVMLAIAGAMVPMFSTFPSMTIDQIMLLLWDSKVSYLSVMFCICCFTAIFWLFMNSENIIGQRGGPGFVVVLPYAVLFIVISASSSPLSIMGIAVLGNAVQFPSAIMLLLAVLFMFGWSIVLMFVVYHSFVARRSRKRHGSQKRRQNVREE